MARGCNPFKSLAVRDYTASHADLEYIIVIINQYMRRYGEPPDVVYIPDNLMESFERLYTVNDPYPHIEYVYRGMSIGRGDCKRLYCTAPDGRRFYGG